MKNLGKIATHNSNSKNSAERLSDRLNQLMLECKIDGVKLGKYTGIPTTTINRLRNSDPNNNPTLTTLVPLANFFSITVSQLIGDEPICSEQISGISHDQEEKMRRIPVLQWEEAILPPTHYNPERQTVRTEYNYHADAYALVVEENDWQNLTRGTALLIDPSLQVEHRDFIIVHKIGQKTPTLKQALYDEGLLYLKPIIEGYGITLLTPEHNILGVVVEYKKNLRGNV